MKLVTLEFQAFGCFKDLRLDFGDNGKQFHLIYGNNEAGKSTALRGLTDFFYGIPARTTDVFRHDGPSLAIAAELLSAKGERLWCVRRKKQQKALFDRNDAPLSDQVLADLLGGISREAFTTIYRLDHETLVRGGEDLRDGKGDLAESLFQAGAGITGLRQTQKALEDEAGELFKSGGKLPPINRAISTYAAACKRSKELSVKPAEWASKDKELAETVAALQRERAELSKLQTELKRLERLKLAWPHAAQLRQVRADLQALGEIVPLPETASQERADGERREREAVARREQGQGRIARIQSDIEKLVAPEELIRQALAIGGVNQRLGRYQQALLDLPTVRVETQRDLKEAEEILRSLRPDASGETGESFQLSTFARERIETLANRYAALAQRATDTTRRQREAAEDLTKGQALVGPETPLTDPTKLRQVLSRVQQEGNLEAMLREAQAKLRQVDEQAGRELSRLGRWSGTGAELEKVALPSIETVGRFDNDFTRAEQVQRDVLQQLEQAREKLQQAETRIQTLQLGGEVPTERELENKRERREAGWQLVRRAWLDGTRDEEQEQAFAPGKPLTEAYEEAVEEADLVADRLRREAKRVGQLAELLATRDESQQRVAQAEAACETARLAHETLHKAWQAEWQPAGIEPATPREMAAWLTKREGVLRTLEEARRQQITVEQAQALLESRAAELREELTAHGEKATANAGLGALIDCAGTLLARMEESRRQRETHEAEINRRTVALEKAEREAQATGEDLRTWREEWSAAVAPLALGHEPGASEALTALRQIDLFRQKKKAVEDGRARIASMEQTITQFENEVAAILEAVAPDLQGTAAVQAAGQLQTRLNQAQQNAAQRKTLQQQLIDEQEQVETSAAEMRGAKEDLARLFAAARCSTREELLIAEEKAAKARNLTRQSEELLRALVPLSGGSPMEEFLTQLDAVHSDELDSEAAAVTSQISDRETVIGELQTTRGQQQAELNAMDGGEKAAQAHEEAQEAAAEIESLAARYLRLRLASGILRRQIERYREENQGPVIRRASELFPRLTRSSFSGLKTGFDEKDRPVLLGLRDSGEEVPVSGMSEGTRDQLYLALRLASLERQMDGCEPIPFVVDDILITFDNDRARDTLQVLAELCSRTQVLFFTHHAHLIELAKESVPQDLLQLHDLSRR